MDMVRGVVRALTVPCCQIVSVYRQNYSLQRCPIMQSLFNLIHCYNLARPTGGPQTLPFLSSAVAGRSVRGVHCDWALLYLK